MEMPRTAPEQAPLHEDLVPDLTKPNAARVYDYLLGGSAHTKVDREFAETIKQRVPFVVAFAMSNRRWLTRVVKNLSDQGVDQFIDIGCGIPTVEPVHEVAWSRNRDTRILYVDYEPVAVAGMNHRLDVDDPHRKRAAVIRHDVRDVDAILSDPQARGIIDFTRPVGLLVVATLHFIGPGDAPGEMMASYRDGLPSGSYFAASHLTLDGVPEPMLSQGEELERLYAKTPAPGYYRNRAEFRALFDGYDIIEPGIVWAPEWRSDEREQPDSPWTTATLVGVGYKP